MQVLEQSFLGLAQAAVPLTLPARLVCGPEAEGDWPVDRIRARLIHPSTRAELIQQTWHEVVRRSQVLGEPWGTVAVAMIAPALHRVLARTARPAQVERAELEQEGLTAVACALAGVAGAEGRVDWELCRAADRAVHRLVYAARRHALHEAHELDERDVRIGRLTAPSAGPAVGEAEETDELSVLAGAVRARVVGLAEARLIARTRLGGESMARLAAEHGVHVRRLYRHRAAAEAHLADHLRQQLRDE
ncbi:hypothetical protein [Streptomyces sp. NBC_00483]|uniref:hypothetical protein n=1 Tax=Streptomyces sp. NBC_00483 TaxID=2975756 RepID=UPI002E173B3D